MHVFTYRKQFGIVEKANVEFFEGEITIEKIKALNKLVEEGK